MSRANKKNSPAYPDKVRGMNFFEIDQNLQRAMAQRAPDTLKRQRKLLEELGEFAGNEIDEQAQESDRLYPASLIHELADPISPDKREGKVVISKRYKDCQQKLYSLGTLSQCFDDKNPESHILPFVTQYLSSQADISTGCPYAMTHPVAYVIDKFAPKDVKEKFLEEITRTDGKTKIGGTWATEQHSGSDVGASETRVIKQNDGSVLLDGLKWFTSAIGFDSFLTVATARPDDGPAGNKGLGLYLVPSHIDDEWEIPNNYNVRHLKDKLGTRGLPTGETELQGAVAYEIVPPPDGVKVMMEALGCSRVHNAMGSAGIMHRALTESLCWASNRETFGKKLIERPMVQKRILDITTEWMAGSALAFEAAASFDDALKDESKKPWMRIVTALAKFKTAEQAIWCTEKAMALGGGNHYTKDFPLERIVRDAHVLPVWEGPEQIQALELMRMIAGDIKGDDLFIDRMTDISNSLPKTMGQERASLRSLTSAMSISLKQLRATPEKIELVADEFLRDMSDMLAYALLCEEAAFELINYNDKTKQLTADNYFRNNFGVKRQPSFSQTPLHKKFNEVINNQPIQDKPKPSGGRAP
jgi:acyl-CoA dehydrogenase